MRASGSFFLLVSLFIGISGYVQGQTLKIATTAPDGTVWMDTMRNASSEIEKRTSGRVRFKFYPGGVMGSDKIVLRKMRVGQLQGGAITSGALAQIYPDSQIYGLPLVLSSLDEVDYVRERMDPVLLKGLEAQGLVGFGIGESGFGYILSNAPIRNVEDLQQQKMWVLEGDAISQTFLETAGVSPIPLPFSDVYTALQTGLLEAVGAPPTAAIALQWHTRVRYLTDTPVMYSYGMLVINRRDFRRLSPEDQAIVAEVFTRATMDLNRRSRLDNAKAKEALRSHGIVFVTPTETALAQLKSIAEQANRKLAAQGTYSESALKSLESYVRDYEQTHGTSNKQTGPR